MTVLVSKVLYPLPFNLEGLLLSVLRDEDMPRWLDDRRAFPGNGTPAEQLIGCGAAGRDLAVLRVLYDALGNMSAPGLPPLEEFAPRLRQLFRRRRNSVGSSRVLARRATLSPAARGATMAGIGARAGKLVIDRSRVASPAIAARLGKRPKPRKAVGAE